ncbi:MAG: ABC transporter permease [Haliscomenobacter sp.]|nr:ABC transporter permease [Haliscomenobacter sp.]MBK9489053.1 ABC transporter permease [Haliscomenobacter sp.]
MLTNYLKIAFRNLMKNKLFTGLNLLGLALGIAVALLLLVFVKEELSFDRYHSNVDHIYRALAKVEFGDGEQTWAGLPNSMGPVMKNEIAGIAEQMRMWEFNFGEKAMINADANKFSQENFYWADSSILRIFDIKLLSGDPATALNGPRKVILCKSVADRYFPNRNAVSQTIKIENSLVLEVTGVYEDFPSNSTLDAEVIGSFPTVERMHNELTWSNSSFETYFLLRPGVDPELVEKQFAKVLDKYVPKEKQWQTFQLQALKDVHLQSTSVSSSYSERAGDPRQVRILIILALVILTIACINYMNLATARSQQRFREVGITKAVGATRMQLARRFYLETAVLVALAVGIALILVMVFLPLFNQLAGKTFGIKDVLTPTVLGGLFLIWLLVSFIAGSYPALMLSSFNPKNLLQASFRQKSSAGLLRRTLVVVQFSASIILMICTALFYQQLNFIQQRNLGYEPEQVVAINMSGADNNEQISAFTTQAEDTTVQVVVNKLICDYLGYTPEEAIGKKAVNLFGYDRAEIVGVMDNFHFEDFHQPIKGYAFHNATTEPLTYNLVKLNTKDLSQSMRQLKETFDKILPNSAFDFLFLDEHLNSLYRREQRTASVVMVFSCLSILIACLGLFGLAAFTAEQRTKEIGVRKVLGASVGNIVSLLSRDFLGLVMIALVFASPVAWYFMSNWLKEFTYRIHIEWWVFVGSGFIAMLIAFVTVSMQSVRAAMVNPVKSLRSE